MVNSRVRICREGARKNGRSAVRTRSEQITASPRTQTAQRTMRIAKTTGHAT